MFLCCFFLPLSALAFDLTNGFQSLGSRIDNGLTYISAFTQNTINITQANLSSMWQGITCLFGFNCPAPNEDLIFVLTKIRSSQETPNQAGFQPSGGKTPAEEVAGVLPPPEPQAQPQPATITQIINPIKETIHTLTTNTQTVIIDQDTKDQVARILRQLDSDRPNYSVGQVVTMPSTVGGNTLTIANNNFTVDSSGNISANDITARNNLTIQGNLTLTGSTPSQGKVLTSDSNGLATWQTLATGITDLSDFTTDDLEQGTNNLYFPGFTDLTTDYGFTDNSTNWNTAYTWGNHATAGYLTSITAANLDNIFSANGLLKRTGNNTYTIDTNTYLTAYTETDPIFSAWNKSSGISITESQISDLQSYLTTETDPIVKAISGIIKSNGTAISAAISGTDYLAPNGSAANLTNFPTLNQNTTGTAAGLSATLAIASGGTGTTNGSITGTGALVFTAGGTNQNITLTPSGSGYTVLNGTVQTVTLNGSGNRCVYVDSSGNLHAKSEDCGSASGGDNLGNHIVTQNLVLGNYWINGDSDNEGIQINTSGNVTISGTVSASNLSGTNTGDQTNITGNAATATALATARAINGTNFDGTGAITIPVNNTDDTTTDATMYPLWTTTADGNYSAKVSTTKLYFNPSTGLLTATGFSGPLTGNVTGNVSGTAATVTNAAQTNITSLGTLTGLTMSGTLAMAANNITMTGSLGTTDNRLTKGWFTDLEVTNTITGSITGSAPTLTTARSIYGNNFNGSADLTQIIASTYGGTGNGFTKFTGPTTAEKTFTLPDASATILTTNAAVTPAQGGTGVANGSNNTITFTGNYTLGLTLTNNTALTLPTSGTITALGNTTTGSGSTLVLSSSPTLVTPALGVASATSLSTPTLTTASGDLTLDPTGNVVIKGSTADNSSGALNVTNSTPTSLLFARNDGNIGVNNASPNRKLDIIETTSATPQMRLSYDGSNYAEMAVNSVGNLFLDATGSTATAISIMDQNLKVCTGGSFGSDNCPASGYNITGTGNLVVASQVVATSYQQICPTGYIWVPGSAKYGTLPGFCVMKYEAKNVGGVATSQTASTPWVSISQTAARSACRALGAGYHLISEAEWMTIADNAANTASNWFGGTVGTNFLYSGHNDNGPANALAASTDDDGYYGTNDSASSCDGVYNNFVVGDDTTSGRACAGQKRIFTLSNGNVIWDISGNVWEWTDAYIYDSNGTYEMPLPAGNWYEYTAITNYKGLNYIRPQDISWSATQSIGRIYTDGNCAYSTVEGNETCGVGDHYYHAFLRGGSWASAPTPGRSRCF